MHFRLIIHSLGTIILLLALTMVLPLFWAIKDQSPGVMAFVVSILVTAGVGLLMKMDNPRDLTTGTGLPCRFRLAAHYQLGRIALLSLRDNANLYRCIF